MQNIKHYSSQELSLIFLNDEFFYKEFMRAVRRDSFSLLENIVDKYFTYNIEQLDDLKETFEQELEEYSN
jgi:hypothetical protein